MSRAPDHEPGEPPPPTNWNRVVLGVLGIVLGLFVVYLGLRGL